jgi:hypothetical protein
MNFTNYVDLTILFIVLVSTKEYRKDKYLEKEVYRFGLSVVYCMKLLIDV